MVSVKPVPLNSLAVSVVPSAWCQDLLKDLSFDTMVLGEGLLSNLVSATPTYARYFKGRLII